MSNVNIDHIGEIRLEIYTSNLGKCNPEFWNTKGFARLRRKQLMKSGYRVDLFEVTEQGGLRQIGN